MLHTRLLVLQLMVPFGGFRSLSRLFSLRVERGLVNGLAVPKPQGCLAD